MADKVLSNIVEGILNSLDGPLAAIDGLENLRDMVSAIKPLLLRAEGQLVPNQEVDKWLGELNDVIYEADDLLDAASTEARRHGLMTQDGWAKKVRTFFFKRNPFALGGKMSNKIKAIGQNLDKIKAPIPTSQSAEPLVRPRSNSSICTEPSNLEGFQDATIIGRENDKNAVRDCLTRYNCGSDISFLPIIGTWGLGKTVLAQLIYHDEEITSSFALKMWVSVGDTFDIKIIVRKLLESASIKIGETSKLEELIVEFRNAIVGRKYFLVLDDIWNEDSEKWSELRNLLICGASGSRVLITTREKNVAKLIHCREPYHLRGLSDEASWHLFEVGLTLPARKRLDNSSISKIARKIVQRCAGIPLTINMVARSFSHSENSEAEWCNFIEKPLESSQRDILHLCYSMLPSHLKYCFTYCGLFPNKYTICKTTLIKLWIAQNFVKSQENLCLEDIGHEYFLDLVRRQFFREPNFDKFGNIISCKMHDFMHELATSMAGPLITMPKNRKINEKTRHVGFVNFPPAMPSMLIRVRFIRTFLYSNIFNFEGECDCETIFSSFKLLRVLDLGYQDLTQVPSSISELKHLRYLDLSNNKEIVKLPKSITSLLNLQTMRLSGCWSLKELPRDIKRLVNLRHLELDDCWELRYMPHGLGQLINLQTLTLFVVNLGFLSKRCAGLRELNRLNNLRGKLVVRDSDAKGAVSKQQPANLMEKPHLTSLYLSWSTGDDVNGWDGDKLLEFFQRHPNLEQLLIKDYCGFRLSTWLSSITNLVKLELFGCKECQCLLPSSQWSSLKYLWLEDMDAIQYISQYGDQNELSTFSSTAVEIFPALETIHLSNCPKLESWWRDSSMEVGGGSHISKHHLLHFFPRLSGLHISKCPHLISMPRFSYLEELYLEDGSWKPLLKTMLAKPAETGMMKLEERLRKFLKSLTVKYSDILEFLSVERCDKLMSLSVDRCDKLMSLSVERCDKLMSLSVERCCRLENLSVDSYSCRRLENLSVDSCRRLENLSVESCRRLENFSVENCPILESLVIKHAHWLGRLQIRNLYALEKLELSDCDVISRLEIRDCKNLTAIPELIERCNLLNMLKIVRCPELTSLPKELPGLSYLWIEGCPKLTSLPKELPTLSYLWIEGCPILIERCKEEEGEDWPKIKDILDRTII